MDNAPLSVTALKTRRALTPLVCRRWKIGAALAAGLVSTGVMASTTNGFGVSTSAAAGDFGAFVGAKSAYRMLADSSSNLSIPGDFAPLQIQSCPNPADPGLFCSASATGTNSPSFDLTASNSSATMETGRPGNPASYGLATASTYSALSTGKLGATVQVDYFRSGLTYAYFNDTLTFSVAGASPSTVTLIGITFSVDGSLTSVAVPFSYASVRSGINFGAASADLGFFVGDGNPTPQPHSFLSQSGWVNGSWSPGISSSVSSTFTGVYALTGASPVLGIRGMLSVEASSVAAANYGNTAVFGLSLPSDVTYSSASGVFLTPVPEPGTTALLLAGLGVVGFMARRRRA